MGKVFKAVASIGGAVVGGITGGPAGAVAGYKLGNSIGGTVSDLAGGGGSSTSTQQGNVANGAYYDPFGASRGIYAAKLNTLMSDPAEAAKMVKASIPYTEGMASGQRSLAANLARTGQTQSGAEQIAYSNLGQDFFTKSYQDLYNQFSTLSGATQAPMSMASANQLGYQQNNLNNQALGQAIGAVGTLFPSTSTSNSIVDPSIYGGNTPAGAMNYAPGATGYSPTNTNIGMGGYYGDANMGGGLVGPSWA
jgi:hypothetical protein